MKWVAFVNRIDNRRYKEGVPFVSQMVYERARPVRPRGGTSLYKTLFRDRSLFIAGGGEDFGGITENF